MPASHHTAAETPRPRRRADAERSIARILDAAVDALGEDQEASMSEIARRAGVVRATIYVHFPTREALLEAVTERAFAEVAAVILAAEPERGDPADALARVVAATWRTLGRYHGLIAINTGAQTHEELHHRHGSVLGRLLPLIERGQADGVFRSDVPAAMAPGDGDGAHPCRQRRTPSPARVRGRRRGGVGGDRCRRAPCWSRPAGVESE